MKKYAVNLKFSEMIKLLNDEFDEILQVWKCPRYMIHLRNYMRNHFPQ